MRLIDADALTEKCGDWYVEEGTEEGFIGTLGQLLPVQPETNCSEIPNNSDTISRQQAIDTLKELTANGTNKGMVFGEDAVHRIEMLPTVQPERKTGHWIIHLYELGKDRYECDSCHKRCDTEYSYCPNCGAKMEGERKE